MHKKDQLDRFRNGLAIILQNNKFYQRKFAQIGIESADQIKTFDDYFHIPFTTKEDLSKDQVTNPPYGTNTTFPQSHYICIHHTSGTTGDPLRWLDDQASWNWWGKCWADVYRAAGVTAEDRIFFAFSFGPFIGFWSAHEGARQIGALAIPGGGMTSLQRLRAIIANKVTVLICTPTYALHLAEIARESEINIANSCLRVTIHAGEPGASIPSVNKQISNAFLSKCYDHVGATEIGAWGFMCDLQNGVHLNEDEFIFEVIDPETCEPSIEGELVITNLGRIAMPVIRYRTGDYVRINSEPCECGRSFRRIDGGVIGRIDDLLIIRGMNIYPSAIENLIRTFSDVSEFAVDVDRRGEMDELNIRIETSESTAIEIGNAFRDRFGLRVDVSVVEFGSLPRFELKARRFNDHRRASR